MPYYLFGMSGCHTGVHASCLSTGLLSLSGVSIDDTVCLVCTSDAAFVWRLPRQDSAHTVLLGMRHVVLPSLW